MIWIDFLQFHLKASFLTIMLKWIYFRIGLARLIALALVLFALTVRVNDPVPVQIVRNLTFDLFQQIKPRQPQAFPVAIIDVDDPSITEIGQWPWPRTRFAELVDKSMQAGAVAVAFDIVFAERDRLSPGQIAQDNSGLDLAIRESLRALPNNDALLAEAFGRGRVVVGQTSIRSANGSSTDTVNVSQVPHAILGPDPAPFILKFPDLVENLPDLEASAAGRGVFSVRPDPDGVYRRAPVVVSVGGQLRLGLAPELLRVATGGQPFAVRTNQAGVDGVVLAGQLVQTAGDGTVRPYLTRPNKARFVSAADLLNDRMPQGRLNGHLVLVGTSAIGLEDYRATPLGLQMPGVEIHAQLLENIMSDTLLKRPNFAIGTELVATFAICLLIIILTPIMNAKFLIGSTLLFLTTLGVGSYVLFERNLVLVDPSFTIACGLATIMFMSAANYLREEQRRRQIRTAFGQYVSKDLVNALSDNSANLRLGGETRDLTLLFSDVRGFTAIAEGFRENPEGLTTLMNRFLNLLSNAILERGGTIDKFMGDAVMAFWNAPMDHDSHQIAACAAALRMKRDVDDLNTARAAEAEEHGETHMPINIGIGINTGTCLVGNMGSDMRFDYTAMGDPVNLASRLEGQSRFYGTSIIVGNATRTEAEAEFALLELDLIRVKGKVQPERIFALLGDAQVRSGSAFAEVTQINETMHTAYRSQNWDAAEAALDQLEPLATWLDPLLSQHFDRYRERIDDLRQNEPPEDWDGVFDATSK
ncbi:MAG: adenylate/guanylate cyclase domain-containing protein [Paracoccaceae bacterium]